MRVNKIKKLFAVAMVTIFCGLGVSTVSAQQNNFKSVSNGEEVKVQGFISSREADSLMMRDSATKDVYMVQLTPDTKVATHDKGILRKGKEYAASYLLRG